MNRLEVVNDEIPKKTINEILETYDFAKLYEDDGVVREQCNVWIPVEYKRRYDLLQKASEKKLSKLLSKVFCELIDRADAAQPKAS